MIDPAWLTMDVLALGMAADGTRRRVRGSVVTYARVQSLTVDDLPSLHPAAHSPGGRKPFCVADAAVELRLYGMPTSLDEAVSQVGAVRAVAGGRRVSAFSLADVLASDWGRAPAALTALVAAGLDDVAELPADRLEPLADAIGAMRSAGMQPRRITVATATGTAVASLLARVAGAMSAHATLQRFAPLPRTIDQERPTTGFADVRAVALARLALPQAAIEVDWQLYGPKLAQVALTFGADYLDAVSALDDQALGPRRAPMEDVQRNIRAAGFEPQQAIIDR